MRASLPLGFVLLTACVTPVEEGELDQGIVGGQTATTTQFPTVVGLQNGTGNWFCTGVLVDKDRVLTAATCIQNTNAIQVRLDDNNIADNAGGTVVNVSETHRHTSFNPNSTTWNH